MEGMITFIERINRRFHLTLMMLKYRSVQSYIEALLPT